MALRGQPGDVRALRWGAPVRPPTLTRRDPCSTARQQLAHVVREVLEREGDMGAKQATLAEEDGFDDMATLAAAAPIDDTQQVTVEQNNTFKLVRSWALKACTSSSLTLRCNPLSSTHHPRPRHQCCVRALASSRPSTG